MLFYSILDLLYKHGDVEAKLTDLLSVLFKHDCFDLKTTAAFYVPEH